MLEQIFLKVLDMSRMAGIIILIVCAARLLLKRFPKSISYMLWSVVLFRLLCPVTLESGISIVPALEPLFHEYVSENESVPAGDNGGLAVPYIEGAALPYADGETGNVPADENAPGTGNMMEMGSVPATGNIPETGNVPAGGSVKAAGNSWQGLFLSYGKYVWLTGIGIFLLYCIISAVRIHNKTRESIPYQENIYIIDEMLSPFVMGIFNPRIYLPAGLGEKEQEYIILHEKLHIRRLDHIVKPVAFAALCIHWFNPLVWLAFVFFCRDMEMSCDEAVIRTMGEQIRADYSSSLLAFSTQQRVIRSIRFGEGDAKGRVKNLAAYKKTKKWVMAVLSVGAVIFIICLAFTHKAPAPGADAPDADPDMPEAGGEMAVSENREIQDVPEDAAPLNLSLDITDFYVTHTGDCRNLYHIDEDNVLWGCGRNEYGQLGQGTQDYDFHEDMVKIAENVIHVDSTDRVVVIFLTKDHKLYGMGTAGGGALQQWEEFDWMRYANMDHYAVTTPVLLMEDVVYACCGRDDVVCMKEDGTVWTWGVIYHDARSVGYLPSEQGNVCFIEKPQKILENAVLVTGGWSNHAALLQDGTVWTWGYNCSGTCGIEEPEFIGEPTKVAEDVVMVWTDITMDPSLELNKDNLSMAWTGDLKYTVDDTITEYGGPNPHYLNNTVIQKADGSYWVCGEHVGTEERVVYGEGADYSVVCSYEFRPCE